MKIIAKNRDGYIVQMSERETKTLTAKWPERGPTDGEELPLADAFNELRTAFGYNEKALSEAIRKLKSVTGALERLEPLVNPIFTKAEQVSNR